MKRYRVTIHEHVIYDYTLEANNREDAVAMAENSISNDETHLWSKDEMAGWTEIGEIYDDSGFEI